VLHPTNQGSRIAMASLIKLPEDFGRESEIHQTAVEPLRGLVHVLHMTVELAMAMPSKELCVLQINHSPLPRSQ